MRQTRCWKSLTNVCLMSWLQLKNNHRFEVSSSFILHNKTSHFNLNVTWDKKEILYDKQQGPPQWVDQKEAPKHFPRPNLHPKNGYGHCFWFKLPIYPLAAFWIQEKPLHLRSILEKMMRWNFQIQWSLQPTLVKQNEPNFPWQCWTAHHTNSAQNLN